MKKKPVTPPAAPAAPVIVASFTLPATILKLALARLKPVVGFRLAHDSFSHVLIARRDGATHLAATDLAVHAVHTIPSAFPPPASDLSRKLAAVRFARENCQLFLAYADLAAAAKDCDRDGLITFTATTGPTSVELSFPAAGTTLRRECSSLPCAEFAAPVPFPTDAPKLTLDDAARLSFFRALEVCSDDETRYVITGVALDGSKPGHHAAVGTDGRQLVYANSIALPFKDVVIVPNSPLFAGKFLRDLPWTLEVATPAQRKHGTTRIEKTMARLRKKLKAYAGDDETLARIESRIARVERYRDQPAATRLRITGDATTYMLRAVEGNYPNYKQVIPDEEGYKIAVPFGLPVRSHLLAILPKLAAEKDAAVSLCIDKASVSLAVGKTHVNLPALPQWKGDAGELRLSMNREFLLRAARQGFEEMHVTSDRDPLVFHAGTSRYVAMPMRVKED